MSRENYGSKDMILGIGDQVQAGVGIFFQQEGDGSVYVKTIVSGGSAERDGSVRVGDRILAVDERQVVGEPLANLRGLILGQQGSVVRLVFERREGGDNRQFETKLMRGTAEYLNGISAWRGMDDEIDDARHQLKQAVAHSAQDREELDRLRKMLQQEREAAQRREQEIEQMQSANADELVKLNETLRRAEQTRRESELKLHPLQQREADLAEELNRQKEKERLRKEYIEELKKRHEEEKTRLEQLHLKEQAGRREDQVARLTAEGMLHKVQHELGRIRDFEQVRREREGEYRARMEEEQARMKEACRLGEQLRGLLRDVEGRGSRHMTDFFQAPPYEPPNDDEEDDALFLG